jgi:transcriptional regulator with XRE-family HTH domain
MKSKIHYPVGHRIRNLRKLQRITQAQLAAMLQIFRAPITRSIVANWETGRGHVPAHCIQLIAYSLRVNIADILPDLTFNGLIAGQIMHPSGRLVQPPQPTDHQPTPAYECKRATNRIP